MTIYSRFLSEKLALFTFLVKFLGSSPLLKNAKIAKQAKNTRRVSIENSSRFLRLLRDLRVYSALRVTECYPRKDEQGREIMGSSR